MGANLALAPAPVAAELDAVAWYHVSGYLLVDDGCWLWTGPRHRGGRSRTGAYGKIGVREGARRRWYLAHRLIRALLLGDVETELDHTCRNGLCVRPSHLEPCDRATNLIREAVANGWRAEPSSAVDDIPA